VQLVSLIEQIRRKYPDLSQSERQVADYVCDHLTQVPYLSIREFKQLLGVSEPTIFRFCQALGFKGYKDFKICLAEQKPSFQDYFSARPEEGKSELQNLVERMLMGERDSIDTTLRLMDYSALEQAAQAVVSARRVCLFGVSTSFDVCHDMQRKFGRLGLSAWAHGDFHDAVPQMARMDENDLVICVSQSGATREVLDAAKKAREFGVPVLAVTAFPSSSLARLADRMLPAYAPEITGNRLGLATRIAQYAVMDALYMAVAHLLGDKVVELMESTQVPLMHR